MIDKFDGEYAFLSNFYEHYMTIDGVEYMSNEHYFQAMKATNEEDKKWVASASTPGIAKRRGQQIALRPDWEFIKIEVMYKGLLQKFSNHELAEKLKATGNEELIEGNDWGDTFWGRVNGQGNNFLGQLLMKVRNSLNNNAGS